MTLAAPEENTEGRSGKTMKVRLIFAIIVGMNVHTARINCLL